MRGTNMTIHRSGQLLEEWLELDECGIPLEPLEFRFGVNSNAEVTIRQYDLPYSGIRELRSGRIAYVIPIFIRRDDPGKTIIRECSLDVPWDDSIEWLDEGTGRNCGWYAFSKQTYPPPHEYARKTVLNHRMTGTLWRGEIREGLLLAVGQVRPPENYQHGEIIPITLNILDQWDRKLSAIFKLRLERCRALDKKIKDTTRKSILARHARISAEMKAAAARMDAEEIREPGNSRYDQGEDRGPQRRKSEASLIESGGGKGAGAEKDDSKR
jgi:hypothetical protein